MASSPPSKTDLLRLFETLVPDSYWRPIKEHESYALIRAMARIHAETGIKLANTLQAAYYLPHASQSAEPASSASCAEMSLTLTRTSDLTRHVVAYPGELVIDGFGGRTYTNAETVVWYPGEGGLTEKTYNFKAIAPGFVGNLDFLQNEDGTLSLDYVEISDQSTSRANIGGSIGNNGGVVYIADSGIPDTFDEDSVGLYVEITNAANASNIGRFLKIVGVESPGVEFPPNTNQYPKRVYVNEHVVTHYNELSVEDNSGGSYAAATTAFFPSPPAQNDAFYIGATERLSAVTLMVTTAAAGAYDLVWEYWNGSAWTALSNVIDGTSGLRLDGTRAITWDVPSDMALLASPLTGRNYYMVRCRITTVAPTFTTEPAFSNVYATVHRPLVEETGTVGWKLVDFKDSPIALTISEATPPTGGRDNDIYLLGDARGVYQQNLEDDDTFRARAARLADAVSPNAIQRIINRALAPYGYKGLAIDSSNGFDGWYWDIDYWDYYTAGDAFPNPTTDPFKLLLDAYESVNHFFVILPYMDVGTFASYYNLNKPVYYPETGIRVNSYYGHAYYDGYPVAAYAIYASIYNSVLASKAGGVSVTMLLHEKANSL